MTEARHDDIVDILKDERALVAAWMLPNDGPLTDKQRREAMGNFARYIRTNGMTAANVAHAIGTPRATAIGELLKGTYRASADAHIRKLNLYVEQHARKRAASVGEKFVTTTKVAKDMLKTARLCRENETSMISTSSSSLSNCRKNCSSASLITSTTGQVYPIPH